MASKSSSFVKQAAILAAASLFVRFIGFLYRIPLTGLIGDTGIAFYGAAYTVYTIAIAATSGTLPAALSKLVSERVATGQNQDAHKMFNSGAIFAIVAGGIAGLVMIIFSAQLAGLIGTMEASGPIRTLGPAMPVVALLAVYRGYFQGLKTAMPTAISQIVEQFFKVTVTLLLANILFDAYDILPAVSGATVGTTIAAIAGLGSIMAMYTLVKGNFRHLKTGDQATESTPRQIGIILFTALPMLISMLIFSSVNFIDIRMSTDRMLATGAFYPEEIRELQGQFIGKFLLLTTLPISLSLSLSSAVIPELSSANVNMDTATIKHKTDMALRISMILAIPAAVGLGVLADPILALLFPSNPDGGWMLAWGAVSIIFISLTHVLTGTLQALGHIKLPIIAAFFGVIIKIPINYFLIGIPSINILGLIISTIACYILASAINMFFLYKHTGILPGLHGAFIKPGVSAAIMGMVCYATYQLLQFAPILATITALTLGGLAYFGFMLLIKGFKESDIIALPFPGRIKNLLLQF